MLRDPKREAEIEFEIKVAQEPWRRVLLDAANLLRTRGWCKGLMTNDRGYHCTLGAIGASSGDPGHFADACIMLRKRLSEMGLGIPRIGVQPSIVVWNDQNNAEIVIAMLESVARE